MRNASGILSLLQLGLCHYLVYVIAMIIIVVYSFDQLVKSLNFCIDSKCDIYILHNAVNENILNLYLNSYIIGFMSG